MLLDDVKYSVDIYEVASSLTPSTPNGDFGFIFPLGLNNPTRHRQQHVHDLVGVDRAHRPPPEHLTVSILCMVNNKVRRRQFPFPDPRPLDSDGRLFACRPHPQIIRNRLTVCRSVFHRQVVINEVPGDVEDKRVAIPTFSPLNADVALDRGRKLIPIPA